MILFYNELHLIILPWVNGTLLFTDWLPPLVECASKMGHFCLLTGYRPCLNVPVKWDTSVYLLVTALG